MRIACVYAPQLPLQAVLRRDPERRQDAIALADGASERAKIVGLTNAARRAGARRGMTVAQARARAGAETLVVIPASKADTEAAAAALADVGYGLAPEVEAEEGRVFFEAGALAALYPAGEGAVAQAIAAHTARLGLAVRVGIAATKAVARIAAQVGDLTVVPPGHERAFLAPVAVGPALAAQTHGPLVAAAPALEETLARWGMRTLGALAALAREEVVLRLGAAGAALHRLACAIDDEPFAPALPPDALEEGTELDYPVYELEPLAFLLRGLVDRALARLACRGLACAGLTLRFALEPKGCDVREVPLAAPTRESATVLQLVRLDLARRPPAAPIVGAAILVLPARVRAQQLDFWRPAGPAPDRLAATLARLAALVGGENVGAVAPADAHEEEEIVIRPFETKAATGTAKARTDAGKRRVGRRVASASASLAQDESVVWGAPAQDTAAAGLKAAARGGSAADSPSVDASDKAAAEPRAATTGGARLGFRRFRPPQPLEVLIGRDGPTALRSRVTTARVLVAAGPYRVSGAWWREPAAPFEQVDSRTRGASRTNREASEPGDRLESDNGGFCRDYWDVQASDGAVYRLHQDRRDGAWYLDGYYD